MKLPSIKNQNPKTWKCKIFGCRDEWLPLTFYEQEECHGITGGFSFATVATAIIGVGYKGCHWCQNYQKITDEPVITFPAWLCDCDICVSANQHRKWLYE
jgi:hypothetical protein